MAHHQSPKYLEEFYTRKAEIKAQEKLKRNLLIKRKSLLLQRLVMKLDEAQQKIQY